MLFEMRMNNEIPKEVFYIKSEEVENKIGELESSLLQYQNIQEVTEEDMTDKLRNLSKLLAQGVELENGEFSESVIDRYVYGVQVSEDFFEWVLNLKVGAGRESDTVGTPVYFKTIMGRRKMKGAGSRHIRHGQSQISTRT